MNEEQEGKKPPPLHKSAGLRSQAKPKEEFEVRDQRDPGWHWADNEVIDVFGPVIGPVGYAIYMYLGRHSDNRTQRCTRTQTEMAATFNMSRERVRRHLPQLTDAGLIAIQEGILGETATYILLKVNKLHASKRGTAVQQNEARSMPQNEARHATPRGTTRLKTRHAIKEDKTLFQDSLQDSSSSDVDDAVAKLAEGLRTFVRRVDGRAVRRILEGCRASVPDVAVDEVLELVQTIPLGDARNPLGLLITAVPLACDRVSIDAIRAERASHKSKLALAQTIAKDPNDPTPQEIAEMKHRFPVGAINPWTQILGALEKKISRHSYETWLKPTRFSHVRGNVIFTVVPTPEFHHIEEKFGDLIQEAMDTFVPEYQEVKFVTQRAAA